MKHINPIEPILADSENWLFVGRTIDAFVATSEAEAHRHADELNSDRQVYAVVRFNAVEGRSRDVTSDFLPEADDSDEDEYRDLSYADLRHELTRMRQS